MKRILQSLTLLFFASWSLKAQEHRVEHTLFLVGDAGETSIKESTLGEALRKEMQRVTNPSTLIYLGDNIYPRGLSGEGERGRERGEEILRAQARWVEGLKTQGIFIPGNHDWQHWGRRGFQFIQNQQRFLDSLKMANVMLLPRDGCPGPVEVPLSDLAVLVILDTQWLLHQWYRPGEESNCEAKTNEELLALLNDVFERNTGKKVIIAGHHPLITYGEHGGVFTLKSHIFPIADLHNLYVPLPGIGSIYPLGRKFIGHHQDATNAVYKQWSNPVLSIMKEHPGSIYVSGHEHALEYIVKDSSHLVVSGSGAKTQYVRQKGYAKFAKDERGFATIDLLDNGAANLKIFVVKEGNAAASLAYSDSIAAPKPSPRSEAAINVNFNGQRVRVKASSQYVAGKTRQKYLGENYRAAWNQEIDVPVFDLGAEQGGLKILQRGGGMQTLSLRLADSSGHEYVLRSIEKFPENAVPEMLRKTFAQDLVQDQISSSHPYAALVVASLAESAGIYHTNPKLVFIPDDPRLGEYRKAFANTLALFEERPAGNWEEAAYFGHSKKIINTSKVIEKLADDNDNSVDQPFVLKSRLFDLFIGDWDRHDDQWRWASFKGKKGEVYRPIPRDRDQAFFVNEGRLARLWSRKWALPKFEGFDEKIDWAPGLSFNARYFDRSFLTALSRQHWIDSAKALQQQMTDGSIEQAIQQWPKEIYDLHGPRIIRALKARRNNLVDDAQELYEFLAREVDVVGSDKSERFQVERLPNGETHVQVYKISKEGVTSKLLYDRIFHQHETKEIRLVGLGGADEFVFKGKARRTIKTRIIGGKGKDRVLDSSQVSGLSKPTVVYDLKGDIDVARTKGVAVRASDNPAVNDYDRLSFRYDKLAPLIVANFNPDDGPFIGGGFIKINHGFRKTPFKNRHLFMLSVAPVTRSFNFRYQAKFTEFIGRWNLDLDANIKSPNFVNNFFGWGNESVFDRSVADNPAIRRVRIPVQFYRYRFEELGLETALSRNFGKAFIRFGPAYQRVRVVRPDEDRDRFIEQYSTTLDYDLFNEANSYAGAMWQTGLDMRNNPMLTTKGIYLLLSGRNMTGLNETATDFASYEGSLAVYQSFRLPARLVIALRAGAGRNTGAYPFYQAQVLDGKTELRGFRKTRFYGDSKVFGNIEARMKLLSFRSYLFPASLGVLAFHDMGRVWYKDENGVDPSASDGESNILHRSVGGGVWFTPFNAAVVSAEVGHSNEGKLFYIRLGFLF